MNERISNLRRCGLIPYGIATLICVLILVKYLGLYRISLREPLQYGKDSLIHLNWIKNIVDTGWYLHNDAMGAPAGQDLRGYPGADTLHHLTIKALTWCTHDVFLIGNLVYLLTFPLTTITTLFVLRRLGVRNAIAVVGSLLYTYLPYHYLRLEHLFLAAYYHVPLAAFAAIRLYQGIPLLAQEAEPRRWMKRDTVAAIALCLMMGWGGAYYAFFACWCFLAAGLAGAMLKRSCLPTLRAFGLIAGTFFFFLTAVLPTLRQHWTEGVSADDVQRLASDSEAYGLKVAQMLIPIQDHRIPLLRSYAKEYLSFMPLNNENSFSSLGLIASFGLLILLARGTLQYRSADRGSTLDGLALLSMSAVLVGTVGGFGSSFSFFLSPWIRCYNRISIFIGFFALAAIALLLESAWTRWATTPRRTVFAYGLLSVFFATGLFDQTPRRRLPDYESECRAFRSDRAFVRQIADRVPEGKMICQWPHRDYYVAHDLRPQLHSKSLRWTHGSLRGHEGDAWNRRLAELPLERQLLTLCRAEAGGICIDTSAYPDRAESLKADLTKLVGPPAFGSPDGQYLFFDLAPISVRLKQHHTDEAWAELRDRALNPPMIFWRKGFFEEERAAVGAYRWASRDAEMHVRNHGRRSVRIRLGFSFDYPGDGGQSVVRIESDLLNECVPLAKEETRRERILEIPPGTHAIRFSTDARRQPGGEDMKRRPVVYRVFRVQCATIESDEDEAFCGNLDCWLVGSDCP